MTLSALTAGKTAPPLGSGIDAAGLVRSPFMIDLLKAQSDADATCCGGASQPEDRELPRLD